MRIFKVRILPIKLWVILITEYKKVIKSLENLLSHFLIRATFLKLIPSPLLIGTPLTNLYNVFGSLTFKFGKSMMNMIFSF